MPFPQQQRSFLSLLLAPFLPLSAGLSWQDSSADHIGWYPSAASPCPLTLSHVSLGTMSTDLITCITGYHKSSHFSDMPHTPPYSQILLSPSMLYKQRGREWVITTNKWQCGAGPQAVTLQADGAVQCTACTAVHCGRRARAIIDLPVCSVRFVVNFEWPHLKQMKE